MICACVFAYEWGEKKKKKGVGGVGGTQLPERANKWFSHMHN